MAGYRTKLKKSGLGLAAVLLMLSVCLLPLVSDDSDAGSAQTYDISMSVGDTFTYTPTVNLTGATISAAGTAMTASGGFLTFTDGVLSGQATAAGTRTVTLTASYTADGLTQTATQTINFTIYDAIAITGTKSISGVIGNALSASYTVTGPADLTVTSDAATVNSSLTGTYASGTYTLAAERLTGTAGTAQTVTVTAHSASADRTATYQITLTPYDDFAVTSGDQLYTYVGQTVTYNITTNYDGTAASLTYTMSAPSITASVGTASISGSTVSLDFLAGAVTGTGNYSDYTFTVTADGTVSGAALDAAGKTVNVRVYKAIAFTSAPTVSSSVVKASASNAAQMSLSMAVTGAQTITYSWGDGTQSVIPSTTVAAATYTAAHSYAQAGVYQIRVVASNDQGSTSSIILYNAGTGTMEIGGGGPVEPSGLAGLWADYSLIIILAAAAALCAAYGLISGDRRFLGLAVVLVLIIAVCWYKGWLTVMGS